MEIKAINATDLEKVSDEYVINPCKLPCVCDGESCEGGWCHGVCWGV